ncbi:hypothetical protein Tco_0307200 [Tanacetum coccineum]
MARSYIKKQQKGRLIKQRMQAAQDRQKRYADRKLENKTNKRADEFEVGDRVMLKVSPWKGVVRFVMPLKGVHINDTMQFVEEPVEIMETVRSNDLDAKPNTHG